MRTTLTLEPDVSSRIESLLKKRDLSRKQLINELLRRGLAEYSRQAPKGRYTTGGKNLGNCRYGSIDDISETLSVAEGDKYK